MIILTKEEILLLLELSYTQHELIDFGLHIADNSLNYDSIIDWINAHCI